MKHLPLDQLPSGSDVDVIANGMLLPNFAVYPNSAENRFTKEAFGIVDVNEHMSFFDGGLWTSWGKLEFFVRAS